MLELAVTNARHTNAVVRNASHKVTGAIERVDNPDKLGVFRASATTFLADKGMVWLGLLKIGNQFLFRGEINLCDEIRLTFGLESEPSQVI